MASIHSLIEDVAAVAWADAEGHDPETHAILLQRIQKLTSDRRQRDVYPSCPIRLSSSGSPEDDPRRAHCARPAT